jgi:hypothetical protein
MKKTTGRAVRLAFLTVGLAGLLAAVNTVPGAATQPSGLTNVTLAPGTDLSDGTIPLQEGTDIVMTQITVVPVDGRDFAVYRFAHDVEVIVP